jgi:hypothetical protein
MEMIIIIIIIIIIINNNVSVIEKWGKQTERTENSRDVIIKNQSEKTCLLRDAKGEICHVKQAENKLKYKR